MRVLLVDDEPLALERLEFAFRDIQGAEVVGTAADGMEALESIAALRPDLIMLDVQMPAHSGMDVARALAGGPYRPELVFVTAFEQYAPDAFAVDAADYLLKPVRFDRLRAAVERARRRQALRSVEERAAALANEVAALRTRQSPGAAFTPAYDDALWVPHRQGAVRVPVESIDWIEAARDYVMLNTSSRSHILRATMSELARRLDPAVMLRVHRSHFVRRGAVVGVERPGRGALRLRLADTVEVQVGQSYLEAVETALGLAS
ncbi:LytR/AlgR family response regulator transcription factor [Muricoccus radiodurans]|uniref:LytR/AlgR family response regulator transcription factor n=1 Tax=Muricoccus radiodurans TaxID=2231721 RepID=UPI003CE78C63